MDYLIKNNKGRVLANPKILLTNGQKSTIDLTSDYVKTIKTESTGGGGVGIVTFGRTVETADDAGIKVEITPFISPDGYITLDIHPEYNTIKEQVFAEGEAGTQDLLATLLSKRR